MRSERGYADHSRNPSQAFVIAKSTSSYVALGIAPMTCWVAGLISSIKPPSDAGTFFPPIIIFMRSIHPFFL